MLCFFSDNHLVVGSYSANTPISSTPRQSASQVNTSGIKRGLPSHYKEGHLNTAHVNSYRHSAPNMDCVLSPVYLNDSQNYQWGNTPSKSVPNSPYKVNLPYSHSLGAADIQRHNCEVSGIINKFNKSGAKTLITGTPCSFNDTQLESVIDYKRSDSDVETASTMSGTYQLDDPYDMNTEVII